MRSSSSTFSAAATSSSGTPRAFTSATASNSAWGSLATVAASNFSHAERSRAFSDKEPLIDEASASLRPAHTRSDTGPLPLPRTESLRSTTACLAACGESKTTNADPKFDPATPLSMMSSERRNPGHPSKKRCTSREVISFGRFRTRMQLASSSPGGDVDANHHDLPQPSVEQGDTMSPPQAMPPALGKTRAAACGAKATTC
mmetsp:Transcript_5884/g.12914  ORF Transcript_5884/g.12914 Transcript_5884/m.12914 type:complete len:202 (-) Transcript_5884:85-690(-)